MRPPLLPGPAPTLGWLPADGVAVATRWAAQGVSTCRHTPTTSHLVSRCSPVLHTALGVGDPWARSQVWKCCPEPPGLPQPHAREQSCAAQAPGADALPCLPLAPASTRMCPGRTQDTVRPPAAEQRQAPPERTREAVWTGRGRAGEEETTAAAGRARPAGLHPRGASVGTPHSRAAPQRSRPQALCTPSDLDSALLPRARPAHSAAGFPHPHPDPRVEAASPGAPARSTSGQFSTEDGRWVPAAGDPGPRSPPLCHGPGPRPWGSRSCLRGAPAGARRVQGQAAPHAGGRWMSGRRGRGATSPGLDLDAGRVPQRDLLPRQAADGARGQDGALRPEYPAAGLGREPAHPGAAGTSSPAHGKGRTCLAGRGQLAGKDSEGRDAETRLPTGRPCPPTLRARPRAPQTTPRGRACLELSRVMELGCDLASAASSPLGAGTWAGSQGGREADPAVQMAWTDPRLQNQGTARRTRSSPSRDVWHAAQASPQPRPPPRSAPHALLHTPGAAALTALPPRPEPRPGPWSPSHVPPPCPPAPTAQRAGRARR